MPVIKEFREFALKGNVLDLAVGVIIGAAFGKIVKGLTDDIIMPVVNLAVPGGHWRNWSVGIGKAKLLLGDLLGVTIDFVIVAIVLFFIVKAINRLKGPPPPPATRDCPACLEKVPLGATRCRACTSELPVLSAGPSPSP